MSETMEAIVARRDYWLGQYRMAKDNYDAAQKELTAAIIEDAKRRAAHERTTQSARHEAEARRAEAEDNSPARQRPNGY